MSVKGDSRGAFSFCSVRHYWKLCRTLAWEADTFTARAKEASVSGEEKRKQSIHVVTLITKENGNLSLVRSRTVMNGRTMEGQSMSVIKGKTVFIGRCVYWSN